VIRARRCRFVLAAAVAVVVACSGCAADPAPSQTGDVGPVRVSTLNIAQGAADRYRTKENRRAQGALLARAGAQVVALQEVDVGVDRSGNGATVSEIAASVAPDLGSCTFDVARAPFVRGDGTILARCAGGSWIFGTSFRGDDSFNAAPDGTPSGIMDADPSIDPVGVDRGADAFYGNAMIVLSPWEVTGAYTIALPIEASSSGAPPSLLDRLARADVIADALPELASFNEATRRTRGTEPRALLVVRVRKLGSKVLSFLTTHLENAGTNELRLAQLRAVVAVAEAERASGRPVVVLADFNATPGEVGPTLAAARLVRAVPSAAPPREIDQIWVDDALPIEGASVVGADGVSDHAFAPVATVR
jgi:endonuclease/exonuclease/phosphatase family metal-dependent hydrolase